MRSLHDDCHESASSEVWSSTHSVHSADLEPSLNGLGGDSHEEKSTCNSSISRYREYAEFVRVSLIAGPKFLE